MGSRCPPHRYLDRWTRPHDDELCRRQLVLAARTVGTSLAVSPTAGSSPPVRVLRRAESARRPAGVGQGPCSAQQSTGNGDCDGTHERISFLRVDGKWCQASVADAAGTGWLRPAMVGQAGVVSSVLMMRRAWPAASRYRKAGLDAARERPVSLFRLAQGAVARLPRGRPRPRRRGPCGLRPCPRTRPGRTARPGHRQGRGVGGAARRRGSRPGTAPVARIRPRSGRGRHDPVLAPHPGPDPRVWGNRTTAGDSSLRCSRGAPLKCRSPDVESAPRGPSIIYLCCTA